MAVDAECLSEVRIGIKTLQIVDYTAQSAALMGGEGDDGLAVSLCASFFCLTELLPLHDADTNRAAIIITVFLIRFFIFCRFVLLISRLQSYDQRFNDS